MGTPEKTIRVGITFNAESHPEWFELLSKVVSGRARADILRAHLTLPSGRFLEKYSNSPVISEPLRKTSPRVLDQLPDSPPQTTESTPVETKKLTVATKFSPESTIVNSHFSKTQNVNSTEKPTDFASTPDEKTVTVISNSERRPGMASMLINHGIHNIGEN